VALPEEEEVVIVVVVGAAADGTLCSWFQSMLCKSFREVVVETCLRRRREQAARQSDPNSKMVTQVYTIPNLCSF
jgi:hypothetical protein